MDESCKAKREQTKLGLAERIIKQEREDFVMKELTKRLKDIKWRKKELTKKSIELNKEIIEVFKEQNTLEELSEKSTDDLYDKFTSIKLASGGIIGNDCRIGRTDYNYGMAYTFKYENCCAT